MPTYRVKGPDGIVHTVNAPEGATQQDAISFVATTKYGQTPPTAPAPPAPADAEVFNDLPTDLPAPDENTVPDTSMRTYPRTPPPQPAAQPPEISGRNRVDYLLGGFNKGILDIVDFPFVMGNLGLQTAGVDPETFRLLEPSKIGGFRESQTGVPASIAARDTPVMDSLRTGLEWGSGAALPSSRASKLPDLLAAGGAMLGEQIGGDTGEMIGGLTGALSPAGIQAAAETASRVGRSDTANTVREAFGRPPRRAAQEPETEAVLNFLRGNVGDQGLQDAAANVRRAVARGEEGSLADLSVEPGIAKVEGSALNEATTREALRPVYERRLNQGRAMYDEIAPQALDEAGRPVVPEAVVQGDIAETLDRSRGLQQARSRAATQSTDEAVQESQRLQREAAEQAEAARLRAEQADSAVGGTGRTDRSSAALAQQYSDYKAELRATLEDPAWSEFDRAGQMDIAAMRRDIDAYTGDMPEAMRADLYSQFNRVLRNVQNMGETADPKDVQYVLSAIKDINRTARQTGDFGTLNLKLGEISDIIDSAMRESPQVGEAFTRAIEATRAKKTMLGGDILEAARRAEPEVFAQKANFRGDQGAATMRAVADSGNPQIMAGAEAYLRDVFRKEGISEKTLTNYGPALDYFPQLRQQVSDAVAAKQTSLAAADTATTVAREQGAAQTQARSRLEQAINQAQQRNAATRSKVSKLELSKYAAKPRQYIDRALAAADDSGDLGRIYSRLQRNSPQAAQSFKSQALDALRRDVFNVDDLQTGAGEALQKKLNRLVNNGVITMDDVGEVTDIIARQEGRRLRQAGGRVINPTKLNNLIDDMASTALTLPLLSALPSGHQLMAAGMLKRNFKRLLQSRRADPAIVRRLEQMLVSPELFLSAMDGKLTAQTTPREMDRYFAGALRSLANELTDQAQ